MSRATGGSDTQPTPASRYTVREGDTFDRIARRLYGTPDDAGLIRQANPGAREPLQPGLTLTIPARAPRQGAEQSESTTPDEVAITVAGERFRFWESMSITRSMDAPDSVSFTAPFEPDDARFRRTFRPFAFHDMAVSVGGERLFTGTLVSVDPPLQGDRRVVTVQGYATPGVLQDCTPPESAWPVEYDGLDLEGIAESIVEPFGVPVDFRGDPGAPFEREAAKPGSTVMSFLTPLAKQRNYVIASTPGGALLFWQSVTPGRPRARLRQGESPLLSVMPNFSPQNYYSHITGMTSTELGDTGKSYTARNPHLDGVLRPNTTQFTDVEAADAEAATRAQMGRMFGNVASYEAEVSTWRDPEGRLWEPNTTVVVHAHGAMIYQEYEFIVRSVTFERDAEQKTATLELAMPGSFSGKIPEVLPWDG